LLTTQTQIQVIGYRRDQEQIGVQEHGIGHVGQVPVQDKNGGELDHAVQGHVLEDPERSDQRTTALLNHLGHTCDILDLNK